MLRFDLAASGGSTRRVYVDDFEVLCADLPDPTIAPVSDAGGGMYGVDVTSSVPADVSVTCTWDNGDDPTLSDTDTAVFTP